MDRNIFTEVHKKWMLTVALRKESVDRNGVYPIASQSSRQSLSARRAWIEIIDYIIDYANDAIVALRKESVDRNCWRCHSRLPSIPVALRKESVDRNWCQLMVRSFISRSLSARRAWIEITVISWPPRLKTGRSPQGERG